jgi:hypothetical protein
VLAVAVYDTDSGEWHTEQAGYQPSKAVENSTGENVWNDIAP